MGENSLPEYLGQVCPLPLNHDEQIILGHGSGGRLTHKLIRDVFLPFIGSHALSQGNDFASILIEKMGFSKGRIAISTDAHVVNPLFYPGGDIGGLSICGTVNDVAMSGGIPLYLSASFIIEEGLPVIHLLKILNSMKKASEEAGIEIVAGDTKVVEKGKADGIFISTTGFGWIPEGLEISGSKAQPGDAILVSGTLGDHGIAVLTARGNLGLETQIESDQAPLNHLIQELIAACPNIHVLRDPTRGGLATTLNEIAAQSQVGMLIHEERVPVQKAVASACDLLGYDPLYIANEGKLIVILPETEIAAALDVMHKNPYGKNARQIGSVLDKPKERVLLQTPYGTQRILDMLSGEMLPRIC